MFPEQLLIPISFLKSAKAKQAGGLNIFTKNYFFYKEPAAVYTLQVSNGIFLPVNITITVGSTTTFGPEETKASNLYFIIGISVAGFFLVVILILVFVWQQKKLKSK